MGWTSYHDETGFPEWLTLWALVAFFVSIAFVSCICYTEKAGQSLESLKKYVIAFCLGLLCASPCLWAPACLLERYWRENRGRQAAQNLAPEAVSCAAPSQADPEAQLPDYPGNSSNQLGNLGNPGNPGNPGNQPRPSAPIDQNTADTSTTPDMTETGGTRVMGDRSDSEIDSPPSYDAAMRGEV